MIVFCNRALTADESVAVKKMQDWKTDAQQKIQKKNAEVAKREKELEQLLAQQYAEQDAIENQRKQKVGKKQALVACRTHSAQANDI